MSAPEAPDHYHVPVRTIVAAIGLVLGTLIAIGAVRELSRILAWLAIAGFFTIVLAPAVDALERRGLRRGLATALVFVTGLVLVSAMLYAFVRPIATRADDFVEALPQFVEDAKAGEGPIGGLVVRWNIDTYIEDNQQRLSDAVSNAGAPALNVARTVANTVFSLVTILVLTVLMLLEAPRITAGLLSLLAEDRRDRVRKVAQDASQAISGYVVGNLLISIIAGLATFIVLSIVKVPFSGVLGLWVAFTDLIPMVGATLGAIPTIGFAFLHSTSAGVTALVFYIVYQQFENHFLQPAVMSKTVNLSPLAVLTSVLIGVELFGVVGALLAIPAAGVIQVVTRDIYDDRRGRFKDEPTVGPDEVPWHLVPDAIPPLDPGEAASDDFLEPLPGAAPTTATKGTDGN
ncbi:MAG: AI-2E family transporter [Acidimicrobiales bacterium]